MDTTKQTLTPEQLTKNLLKSVRKGHKQHKQKIAEIAKEAARDHEWDKFGGHCRGCGISAYGSSSGICPAKEVLK